MKADKWLENRIWKSVHSFNGDLRHRLTDDQCRYLMDIIECIAVKYRDKSVKELQLELRKTFINELISTEK